MERVAGRVWKFGDDIDTGQMAIGRYTRLGVEVYAVHCLENLRPEFAQSVQPGDILVAGKNFGSGSSRETAVRALRHLGVGAVVAVFFSRLFFRNAINLGLPVMECSEVERIAEGDHISVHPVEGRIVNHTCNEVYPGSILPQYVMPIIEAGGLVPYLEQKLLPPAR